MSDISLYQDLKSWQQGLAALVGFLGLMSAALWNFRLNRQRDAYLRAEEIKSVAAALYGEIVLLRIRVSQVAKAVASVHLAGGMDAHAIIKFDKHFVEANRIPEPMLYKSLAPKFGLLPSALIIPITSFYESIQMVSDWLPQLVPQADRPYTYSPLTVFEPATDAVVDIVPALIEIEAMIGISESATAKKLDLGKVETAVEMERLHLKEA